MRLDTRSDAWNCTRSLPRLFHSSVRRDSHRRKETFVSSLLRRFEIRGDSRAEVRELCPNFFSRTIDRAISTILATNRARSRTIVDYRGRRGGLGTRRCFNCSNSELVKQGGLLKELYRPVRVRGDGEKGNRPRVHRSDSLFRDSGDATRRDAKRRRDRDTAIKCTAHAAKHLLCNFCSVAHSSHVGDLTDHGTHWPTSEFISQTSRIPRRDAFLVASRERSRYAFPRSPCSLNDLDNTMSRKLAEISSYLIVRVLRLRESRWKFIAFESETFIHRGRVNVQTRPFNKCPGSTRASTCARTRVYTSVYILHGRRVSLWSCTVLECFFELELYERSPVARVENKIQ